MDRRSYLAAAGLVLAGCSGTPTDTATQSPTETAMSTMTATATDTATPTDTETPSPTSEPTPTATPEPSEVELQLRAAIEDLDAALDAFDPLNGTILDVTATSVPFSQQEVRNALNPAQDHLDTAADEMTAETPDELRTQHQRLTGVHWYLWWAAPAQVEIKSAAEDLLTIETAAYAGADLEMEQSAGLFEDDIDTVQTNLEKLRRDSDPEDATAPTELTEELYREKLNQFEAEIVDMEELVSFFKEFLEIVTDVETAIEDYEDRAYEEASSGFYSASSSFETQAESLNSDDYRDEFSRMIERTICVAEAMAQGCSELDVAATAGMNGNESKQETARENAKREFEQCDLVFEHMGFLAEFFDADSRSSLAGVLGKFSALLGS
ncbi:hypothetical protein B4589_001090 [Halolamina sp. CBA1230]|uniref:hypothetical protein n=1 Tax=Halolamina sp. CBA1230 TaxID=1853690 RepID=UPI00117BB406|nr:hypothetical protein [Halolamina sp. CBA1230]QKY19034.1 hypothetical protein B4589_001090 [Halolamina sp. CBA1230]